jgi:hypothetical protein
VSGLAAEYPVCRAYGCIHATGFVCGIFFLDDDLAAAVVTVPLDNTDWANCSRLTSVAALERGASIVLPVLLSAVLTSPVSFDR